MSTQQFEYIKSLVGSLNPKQLKLLRGKINETLGEKEKVREKAILSNQELDMISKLFAVE
ncbi:hypothetical protein [Vibrio sonorensis]|uniref:hypothetical protein n=1 Tax=Vibrio sonorensis TaxID=1004316 RepID=UPI0008D969B4|nr:hypothetical protein [Vibrio sonorensis]